MGCNVTLTLRGIASAITGFETREMSTIVRVRLSSGPPSHCADAALVRNAEEVERAGTDGFRQAIVIGDFSADLAPFDSVTILPDSFAYISDGDILGIEPRSKRVRSLYRRSSRHNSFLVTERCNHNCLMCSQPPRNVNDRWLLQEISRALPLVPLDAASFSFTGGEPLLDWQDFTSVLSQCRDTLPNTAVHVLTNGRAFARTEVVDAWAAVAHPQLMAGIPIYASVDHVHDYVVQARGAFDETVLGILKLKERKQRVEVRVVLHAITAPILAETCRWLSRNLPFVDHVALMGLENTGFAIANDEQLWIDPVDYANQLRSGVEVLARAGINVSIYNLPRCVLPKSVWPYAVQSISDWKNGFVESCAICAERSDCSGFFTTGKPRYSRGVTPILASPPAY